MRLDSFDYISIALAAGLMSWAVFLGFTSGGPAPRLASAHETACSAPDSKYFVRLASAKARLEAGQVKESIEALKALAAESPALGEPHALLGQAYARLLDYPSAMKEYRYALLIDPDYVDGKSPKFIGRRIKAAVRECVPQLRKALDEKGGDERLAAAMSDAKYLERMLAGGCE